MGDKHRSAYARVAHLAAVSAEALLLAGRASDAHDYLDELHARFPRHTSFRRELRTIAPQSPLLG